jgi:hypothetical protein
MKRTHAWVGRAAGSALLLAIACKQSLPTAPSELTTGITIYEHANFSGASAHIQTDLTDLEDFTGPCKHDYSTTSPGGATSYHTCGIGEAAFPRFAWLLAGKPPSIETTISKANLATRVLMSRTSSS